MSYAHSSQRYPQPSRHDSYYATARNTNAYSRHDQSVSTARQRLTAMDYSVHPSSYSSYPSYSSDYEPRAPPLPRRSAATPQYRDSYTRKRTWPPSPSVEDETASLTKEVRSERALSLQDGEPPGNTRGAVDQEKLMEEVDFPNSRYAYVPETNDDYSSARYRRRPSVAERGNMAYINTDLADPPVFTERTPTPYAYTKPQKESTLPSPPRNYLSPEPMTPANAIPSRSIPIRETRDAQRDRDIRSSPQKPSYSRHDSLPRSSPPVRSDAFDDSDLEAEDTTHLRTAERKPARYSFVKSDLQRDDLRTNLRDSEPRPEPRRRDSNQRPPPLRKGESSGSPRDSSYHSPRSSSSSLNSSHRRHAPAPVDTGYHGSSRAPSRPASPSQRVPSPKLPPRLRDSPPTSRPSSRPSSSRGNTRPASPLSFSTNLRPPSSSGPPPHDYDRTATYPPVTGNDRSRPSSRIGRHETMPVPAPRIDVQSPSPARGPASASALPYPVDDHPLTALMPSEEHYQFDHSTVASPRQAYPDSPRQVYTDSPRQAYTNSPRQVYTDSARQAYPDSFREPHLDSPRQAYPETIRQSHLDSPRQAYPESPRVSSTSIPGSPRLPDETIRPLKNRTTILEDSPRTRAGRSNSIRSQASLDDRREKPGKASPKSDIDRPLPSCPRDTPTGKYDDWYSLKGYHQFDICPSCFDGVFADTPFAIHFSQSRIGERPVERICDFSSPWTRLAWLLTIKQRQSSLEFIYSVADVCEISGPCPDDRELSTDRVSWYGIADQRDGLHIANFAICSCDKRMIEALFPTMRGYFTKLPSSYSLATPNRYMCSLRTSSRRFPNYLDLLVELDAEAQDLGQRPNMNRFIQKAREYAFKGECGRDKTFFRKPWHFIPSLPEFTVCEECYDELIWPAINPESQSRSKPPPLSTIPGLMNKTIQLVPGEDPDIGSSCCLYSRRMRRAWELAVREDDFTYLKRKAVDRKRAEARVVRERKAIMSWMAGLERGGREWERAKSELKILQKEWEAWE